MWIDLSWPVEDGMPVYPGDRQTRITIEKEFNKDGYAAFSLSTGLHAGTHMDAPMHLVQGGAMILDAPMHLVQGGAMILDVPLSRCFVPGILLDVRNQPHIGPPDLPEGMLRGRAVLLLTGMEEAYGTPAYYRDHPAVSEDLAELLVREGAALLGMDMPSPDFPPFPVHKLLLAAGIPIVENLRNLHKLQGAFEVAAFPLRIAAEASLVRAAARLTNDK